MTSLLSKKVYTNADVKKAGDKLLSNPLDSISLDIVSYWRGEHTFALNKAYDFIKKEAKSIDKNAFVAKRLKRLPSIIDKYKVQKKRNKNIKLPSMQDIGGCRVVVSSIKKVYHLIDRITKNSTFDIRDDYIEKPNATGYKSVHLVGKFLDKEGKERKIELQIRTELQHSWATAVEIIDIFTDQKIKSNTLKNDWTYFFKNCSAIFTSIEKYSESKGEKFSTIRKRVIGKLNKINDPKILTKLKQLYKTSHKLKAMESFEMYSASIKATTRHIDIVNYKNGYVLINVKKKNQSLYEVNTKLFSIEHSEEANKEYLMLEKKSIKDDNIGIIALISTSAVGGIKEAYPNYFADSEVFLQHLVSILLFCKSKNYKASDKSIIKFIKGFILKKN